MQELYTQEKLKELQGLSLDEKIEITQDRIEDWYMQFHGNVSVNFSGGKDSTVLLHLVRTMFPEVPAVFCDTGLEYPEVRQNARETKNVVVLRPKMTFFDVIKKYGYPIVSKEVAEAIYYARGIGIEAKCKKEHSTDMCLGGGGTIKCQMAIANRGKTTIKKQEELMGNRQMCGMEGPKKSRFNKDKWFRLAVYAPFKISHYCCNIMKKQPLKKYQTESLRVPIIATMATESLRRKQAWLRHGCNAFHSKDQKSQPMSFWTEQDVLEYIRRYKLKIPSVYGDIIDDGWKLRTTGCQRTGCTFCAFGAHLEKGESRFQRLAKTHPKLYRYCIDGGEWIENPDYDPSLSNEPNEIGWIDWNPPKLWIPNKNGLGMGKVFDIGNELYEKEMWRY